MKNVLAIIPARGGSKGIPRKNLRPLNDKPLIYYSITNCLQSKFNIDVYVSTEDEEIAMISKKFGAKIHHRSKEFSDDATTLDPVIFNALESIEESESKKYDLVLTIQPTSPLLSVNSLDEAIQFMCDNEEFDTCIAAINNTHLSWLKSGDKFVPNYEARVNRQYLPQVFMETGGFFISKREIVTKTNRIGDSVHIYELPANEAIDIDTFEDWNLCEYYLRRKRIVFSTIGYSEVGLGHIYNSLIIAGEILNHEVVFIVDKKSDLGFEKISLNNYKVLQQQSENITDDILALKPDVVVSDCLDTSIEYMSILKNEGVKLINFEDLGEGSQLADLVFNAIYPDEFGSQGHYFGPDYFCARDEFILTESPEIKDEIKSVLITYGGVDPLNLTKKTLDSISEYCDSNNIEIKVVLGLGYQDIDNLSDYSKKYEIVQNVLSISEYMSNADLVFTSAGRTTYELALLEVPSVVIGQNLREMKHFFAKQENGFENLGIGTEVNEENILNALIKCQDKNIRLDMKKMMAKHQIRKGKKTVINLIKNYIDEN